MKKDKYGREYNLKRKKTLYTDFVDVYGTKHGITLFLGVDDNEEIKIHTKIGFSKEMAKRLYKLLKKSYEG